MEFSKASLVLRSLVGILGVAGLTACSVPQSPLGAGQAHDPYEENNRKTHEFNKSLDRALMGSSGETKEQRPPSDLAVELNQSVGNFADNLALPGVVVNKFLQGDLKGFSMNTYRFAINTVLGIGGLFDVATDFGVGEDKTDFGETLHVWGAPEGAYVELPVLGPSTERDAAGKVVDLFTNPLSYILPKPEKYIGTAAKVAAKVSDRKQYSGTVDSILYESADSYAASRSIYLQNRRYELGDQRGQGGLDPYADPYSDPYEDPYAD